MTGNITDPEKALLDTLYMQCNGLAELLPEDVDMGKLDPARLDAYCGLYPAGGGQAAGPIEADGT